MLHLVLKIICLIDLIGCDVKHEPIQDRKRGFEWILLNALIQPCIRSNLNLVRQDFGLGGFQICATQGRSLVAKKWIAKKLSLILVFSIAPVNVGVELVFNTHIGMSKVRSLQGFPLTSISASPVTD